MGHRRDAALAGLVLAAAAVAAVWAGAPLAGDAIATGAAGALLLECLLSLRAARVRTVWSCLGVQAGSVVAVAVVTAVALVVAGAWVLTSLVAGLVTYLLVLGAVTVLGHFGVAHAPVGACRRSE